MISRRHLAPLLFAGTALLTALALPARGLADPPRRFELNNNELVVPSAITFETGSDKLKPESDAALQYVADYLKEKTYISLLRIEGHTAREGDEKANQTLSEKRALAVAAWLVAHGTDCKRLIAVGFGSTKPVASNDSPEDKAKNRRITFVNAALKGRPIGGMPVDGSGKVAGDVCK